MVTGSHLDSVPDGGAFDGPLGVVSLVRRRRRTARAGLAAGPAVADRQLRRRGGRPVRRGLRRIPAADRRAGPRAGLGAARRRRDRAGRRDGARPARTRTRSARDDERLDRIGAFVELHVEQGRALVDLDRAGRRGHVDLAARPLALRLRRRGQPRRHHPAGGPARPDADLRHHRAGRAQEGPAAPARWRPSAGSQVEPNGTNAIPSRVRAWLDAPRARRGDAGRAASPRSRAGRAGTGRAGRRVTVAS